MCVYFMLVRYIDSSPIAPEFSRTALLDLGVRVNEAIKELEGEKTKARVIGVQHHVAPIIGQTGSISLYLSAQISYEPKQR